jgi:predicted nucleic acid-binding protein
MKDTKVFVDTNILLYAFTNDDEEKKEIVLSALDKSLPVISTQVIKEFAHVFVKKKSVSPSDTRVTLQTIIDITEIVTESVDLTFEALHIHERFGFSFYDSLIVAAAISADCAVLFSEDMKHKQSIGGQVEIVNPFK